MKKRKISLVVLNFNGAQLLEDYMVSLFSQTLLPDEIFLLDNNSTDGSVEFVKRSYPRVKIIRNDRNYGTAEGSNLAFSRTTGDLVIFQSNDIALNKNCVRELVKALDRQKNVGICTSVLLNAKTHLIDNAGGVCDVFGFPMQKFPALSLKDIQGEGEVFFSYGGSFAIRRKLFEAIGGFDHRYFTLNDDVDLCWRARLRGAKVFYSKKSIVYHKVSATLGKIYNRGIKHYWSERNAFRTHLKNQKLSLLILTLPAYLLLFLGEMFYFLYRGKFNLFFWDAKALFWNALYLPETLFFRYRIQSEKKTDASDLLEKTSFKLKLFREFKKAI